MVLDTKHNNNSNTQNENEEDDLEVQDGRLTQDTLKYFQRVEQVLDDTVFEDDDHKATFMTNVFNEMETDGTHLARHSQKTSRIIEKIIPNFTPELFSKFTLLVQGEYEMLSCDRFASHVIETLCRSVQSHSHDEVTSQTFVKFCRAVRKKYAVLIRDTYGSHVLSTILQVLSGVKISETVTKSRASRMSKKKYKSRKGGGGGGAPPINQDVSAEPIITEVPHAFKKCFKKYVEVIQEDFNFGELLCHRNASPVLQVLLLASSKVSAEKFQTLYSSILSRGRLIESRDDSQHCGGGSDEEFESKLPVVLTDEIGSHLFEALLRSANEAQLHELGERCFKRCILTLCAHPLANYVAQTFLKCVKSLDHVDFFVSRITAYTEDVLASGSMSCVLRVAELIAKFQRVEHQKKFISTLAEALHIPEGCKTQPLCRLLMCMKTYDLIYKTEEAANKEEEKDDSGVKKEDATKNEEEDTAMSEIEQTSNDKAAAATVVITKEDINYHGCCLINNLLSFKKSKSVVESFLELTLDELDLIARHPNGSFCFDTFMTSEHIPDKSKLQLAETLLSHVTSLATDKWGSRVVDTLYKHVEDATWKERVKNVLRRSKSKLESDLYGRIVLYNCGVKQYVEKMKEIEEKQLERKRKLFEDILEKKSNTNKDEHEGDAVPLVPAVVVPKKKKIDDRAEKYRRQLESLGISYNTDNTESSSKASEDVKEETVEEITNTCVAVDAVDDDGGLGDVLQAIEASVKHKKGKKKVKI